MRIGIDARKIGDFGIGTYVEGLLHGLASLVDGEQYVVFVKPQFLDRIPAAFERIALDVPNYSIRELLRIPSAARRARLDLFHSPHFVLPPVSCPAIVTVHDLIPLHFPYRNPVARLYYGAMLRRALNASVRVLTVSETVKQQIVGELHAESSRVIVTPNGIDADFVHPSAPPAEYGRYFLYVGNDKPHKNVAVLIEAFERARRRDPALRLVMAGASFVRFRGRESITCAGFVDRERLAALYRGAIALVLPSLEEGFGLPAAEAMASGTAVITSTTPALRELTASAALDADPHSPDAFADAMLTLATRDDVRAQLIGRGRERARALTWQRCAELTREVYRSVLPTRD